MDYVSGPYTITFPAGTTTATFNVSINDDDIVERDENFELFIDPSSLPTGVIRAIPDVTTLTILDDDRK